MPTAVRWAVPLLWVAIAVAGGEAVAGAIDGRSGAVRATAVGGCWAIWGIAAVAMVIPSTVSLTIVRVLVPASVVATVVTALGGAPGGAVIVTGALALTATAACLTAELGAVMVQASAYGDEVRLPLRPPVGYLVVAVLAWLIWISAATIGALLVAAGSYGAGIPLATVALALTAVLPRRWHRLSRRWLVLVPAGLVVHDHLVLAETLMVRRRDVRSVALAWEGTAAVDLTGPTSGHVVEVATAEPLTVLVAAPSRRGDASPIAAQAFLVAPSRPGRALAEAARRRLPVGASASPR